MIENATDQVTIRRRGTGLIACDPDRTAGGYTLFAPLTGLTAYLVDVDGQIAHHWKLPYRPGRHAVILPNGNLGYSGNHPDSPDIYPAWSLWHGGAFFEIEPDGKIVWQHTDLRHHHDTRWLPNGNLLYTTVEPMPRDVAARVAGGSAKNDLVDGTVYADVVKEVNRAGDIEWIWRTWEHLEPSDFPIHPIFDRYHWPLINGVDVTRDGLVLMSLRVTSGVIAVDRSSGEVVWRIGHDTVAQQHAPVELENGNILIFDNGNLRPGIHVPYSRVIEVDPISETIMWEYSDWMRPAFFAPYMGSAERLSNGNTFITESPFGRLFEVTPDGETVWEYAIPYFAENPDERARQYASGSQNSAFRTYRYQKSQNPWP